MPKYVTLFESFTDQTKPPIQNPVEWYRLCQSHLAKFEIKQVSVEVYGKLTTQHVFEMAGYPNFDETVRQYGIILRNRQTKTYSDAGLVTVGSTYSGPAMNMEWLMDQLKIINDFYEGKHNKIEIESHLGDITEWGVTDWLEDMELIGQDPIVRTDESYESYQQAPDIDPRMEVPPEFLDRIITTRRLMAANLLPDNYSIADYGETTLVFAQYSDDRWALTRIKSDGSIVNTTNSDGKYRSSTDYENYKSGRTSVMETMVPSTDDPNEIPVLAAQLRDFARLSLVDYPLKIDDSQGREIYSEDEDGDWNKSTYADDGKGGTVMTNVGPDGAWYKEWMNEHGQVYRFENFTGYWEEVEFNGLAKADAYKNSQGKWWKKVWNNKDELVRIDKDPETTKKERDEEYARNKRFGGNPRGRKPKIRLNENREEDIRRLQDLGLINKFFALERMSTEELLQYADPVEPILEKMKAHLVKMKTDPRKDQWAHRESFNKQYEEEKNYKEALENLMETAGAPLYVLKIAHGPRIDHAWSDVNAEIIALPDENPEKWGMYENLMDFQNSDGETIVNGFYDPGDVGGLHMFTTYLQGKSGEWSEIYYSPTSTYLDDVM
jgi:hypothetical protein